MKIFTPTTSTPSAVAETSPKAKGGKKSSIIKKEMSADEIRQKVAANAEISDAAKAKAAQNSQKLGEGFMKSDDHLLKSDVQVNDPRDPVTSEKLKTILERGAFNFNPKERDVLEKILAE